MELRKRVLSIVLSVLLIMASIPALMIPADAAGLRTLSVSAAGQSSELPLDSTAYYSAAQAVYTADELGNTPFTVQAMTINVDGAPDYGIWRSFEIYMVNVPAGTGFEDSFNWYELTEDDAVLFGPVQLYNGENVIPFRYAFDYDGESDVLMCIVSADGTVTDDPAVFGTRAGTSIVYNGDWFADVLDPDCMAETEGTLIGEIPAVTFLSNYERTVTVTATAGGTVEADYASAEAGTVVTLTAAPDEGYELMGYRVYTADGEQIEVVGDTFVVPTADVFVLGYFKNIMDGSCWFRYGTGDAESSTGLGESTMIWEIMIPADDIVMLGYDRLTAVGFYYVEEFEGDYWFTVYLNGEAVYSTSCAISGESRWVDVELEEVIELDGTQDVEVEVYTEGFVAPASFTEDCGVPYARLVWNDYYGGLIDMYDMGMPVTWLIHAQFGWDLPSYTVTLHKNSGADTTAAADPAVINTPYAQPACPFSVAGKTFGGWSLTPGGAPVSFPVVLEEDTDLYALWTSHPCTVTYDANNGTGDKQTSTVDSGSVVTLPACPFTAAGKRFIGWALTPNGTKISAADGYTVTGNVTFYALWETCEYTVSFNANGGSGTMKAVTAEAGKTFTLPACTFTAPQYKQFAGWSLTKDGAPLTAGFTVKENTTLYAVWKSVPCKVVYDANGGTGTPVTVTLDAGTKLILPACSYTAPANKHFAGWSLTKDGSALTGEYTVTGNITFYALWSTTTYEVTFDANGGTGTMKAATAESGKALTLPACTFTAPQYKQFAGWSLTKDGALLGSSYTFTKNTTLYAVWKAVPASVSFDANGGTGTMKAASLKQGDFFTLPACTFTAPLYKQFAGWSLTKDGAPLTAGFTVTKDTTLYAVWKSVPCKVVYDANGGTGTPVTVTLDAGTKLILPGCSYTAPANKHFAGWSLTKDGSALTGEYTVTGNVTFYALWSTTTYEVTFDANGGTGSMKAAIAESGKALTLPACTFTAPQYKQFAGWSLTKDGALLAKDFTVTKNTTLYAIWKAVPASVSFDANGGTGTMKAAALNLGDTFRIPACTFAAPQYKQFAGWSLTKDGALITKDFTVKENTTLYAIWKAVPASVSFDANGGTGTMKAAALNLGDTFRIPACTFTAPQYKQFAGWSLTKDGALLAKDFTVKENTTLYAIWKAVPASVSFDANGGIGTMKAAALNLGDTFRLPACTFTAPQYKQFAGWSLTKDGALITKDFTVKENTTLYAIWKSVPCKVVYDLNGGTGTPVSVTLDAGTKLILPGCSYTAPANKHFAGWSLTKDGSALTGDYTVTGNVTFYALWATTIYEVTFDANGGSGTMKAATVESGKALTLPACAFTAPKNKQFAGWSLTKDGALLGSSYTFTENTTLYAIWKAIPASVSFDANGGTGTMKAASLNLGDTFRLPACGFTAPQYGTFLGWSLTADGRVLTDSLTITGSVTLYAIWQITPPAPVYTVSFDANGGKGSMASLIKDENDVLKLPACGFTAPQYGTFLGWSLTADGRVLTDSLTITGDVTLYAIWQITPPAPTYTVSFDANGGTGSMDSMVKDKYSVLTLPACGFTAPQYGTFLGWSLTADGRVLTDSLTITGNVTLYAIWQITPPTPTYTVSFDANGGTGSMTSVVLDENAVLELPACGFTAPANCRFIGWAYAPMGEVLTEDPAITDNTTLFAVWEVITFKVSFDANGGTGTMTDATAVSGEAFLLPRSQFKAPANLAFAGWSLSKDGALLDASYTFTADTTVYAIWKSIPAIVTFKANGGTGTMLPIDTTVGTTITLPACGFTAPEGKLFAGWAVGFDDSNVIPENGTLTISADTVLYAIWVAQSDSPTEWAIRAGLMPEDGVYNPEATMIYSEFVYRLWILNGSPEAKNRTMYFTDVDEQAYYYEAVLWACEKGYLTMPSSRLMEPGRIMSQIQIIYVMYAVAGHPDWQRDVHYTDTYMAAYYIEALDWAVDNGVVLNPEATSFGPHSKARMSEILMWMYRFYN